MRRFRVSAPNSCLWAALILVLLAGSCASRIDASSGSPTFHQLDPASSVAVNSVAQLDFELQGANPDNPIAEVSAWADFTSPAGVSHHRAGFYLKEQRWAIRFQPDEPGIWRYRYSFQPRGRALQTGAGQFVAHPSGHAGRLKQTAENPFRFVTADGHPYFPIGLQDCVGATGDRLGQFALDGEMRGDHAGRRVSGAEYFRIYREAGFNLLRFSQRNCSYNIHEDMDHYNIQTSAATDELLQIARANGFRVLFGIFGHHGGRNAGSRMEKTVRAAVESLLTKFGSDIEVLDASDPRTIAREVQFIDYCVARWGEYVDFWELLNERQARESWARIMANRVKQADPLKRLVGTSWDKPYMKEIDVFTPHWYESENEADSDRRVTQRAAEWKVYGKPVLVGEQGNSGMNWDPSSALRMRIRLWTALFEEIGIVFWNTSWSKQGMFGGIPRAGAAANIYLGPQERHYTSVLRSFSDQLDANVRMGEIQIPPSAGVRAYGLHSPREFAAYLHHYANHQTEASSIQIDLPAAITPVSSPAKYEWWDPSTGRVISKGELPRQTRKLIAPPFRVDAALLVRVQ